MMKNNNFTKHIDFELLDIVCLIISFFIGNYIRHKTFVLDYNYNSLLIVILLIQIVVFLIYEPFSEVLKRGYLKEFTKTFIFDAMSFLMVLLYLFVIKNTYIYSRLAISYIYIFYIIISWAIRCLYKKNLLNNIDKLTHYRKSLLIIANNKDYKKYVDILKNRIDYKIFGICIIDSDMIGKKYNDLEIIGDKTNIIDIACKNHIDEVLICMDIDKIDKKLNESLSIAGITKHILISDKYENGGEIQELSSLNVLSYSYKTFDSKQLFVKRIIDIIGGFIGCFVVIILTIIIGPIIKVNSPNGPIFYLSDRVGKNGKIFKMYKFRSMIPNAESQKKELENKNKIKDGMMFKMENDPRIIPGIGSFIRKTSLDEFPQFFNVLKGDMSLVGTRPPTVDEFNKYKPEHRIRLSVKPGITGLWQISGRSNIIDFKEVVRLDKEYIDNWDITSDIKILFKTVIYLFSKKDDVM